jgi:hypothetical protein
VLDYYRQRMGEGPCRNGTQRSTRKIPGRQKKRHGRRTYDQRAPGGRLLGCA